MTQTIERTSTELRVVEPDDLFRLSFVQGADLSPDGRTVVYAASSVDDKRENEHIALWLVAADGGPAKRLTAGTGSDTSPQWSPDGSLVAFVSSRSGAAQIHVIAPDGGEARQVTTLEQGVGGPPEWSPDGSRIAFTTRPPGEVRDPSKPFRVTRHMYRFDAMGYVDDAVQDIWFVDVASGEAKQLTSDEDINAAPAWAPDGAALIYSSMLPPDTHEMVSSVRTVDLDGNVRVLTTAQRRAGGFAVLSDGRVAFTGDTPGRKIGSHGDLLVTDGATAQCRTTDLRPGLGGGLQPDMPHSPVASHIAVGGDDAFVSHQVGGRVEIVRVRLTGDEKHEAVIGGDRSCGVLAVRGDRVLFAAVEINRPTEMFVANTDGSDERRVTTLNDDVIAGLALPSVEHIECSGVDGTPIEGWFLKPQGADAPSPTVLYIHGGPHAGFGHTFSFDMQMLVGAGFGVLFANQRGSTGYGDEFASSIIGDWGNLDYLDLMSVVDAAIARGLADADRLGVCGLSGGGNLSCWIVGQTERFKAAVPENPVTDWVSFYGTSDLGAWFAAEEMGGTPWDIPDVYAKSSPITFAHRCRTPTLLVQGEHDWRCPAGQSEQFYTTLKASGCTVEMLRLPLMSHGGAIRGTLPARIAQNDALLDWMRRYVQNVASAD